jgi:hypothetical protein
VAAVDIPIDNAGFEDNPVAMGCFAVFQPNDWQLFDPNGIQGGNDVVGGIHPLGGPYFPAGAPEGDHASIVFLQGDIGGGPMGLTQTLDAVLVANETYTLSAQVGNIASGQGPPPCDVFGFFDLDGFPGYQVQLLSGGVVVAQDDNTLAGAIPEGEFRRSIFEMTIPPDHPQLGETLEVRLINLNQIDTPEDPGIEVDFDDVRLTTGCDKNGDVNGDGLVNGLDIESFVGVMLGTETNQAIVVAANLDCSTAVDDMDIQLLVSSLLN